VLCDELGQGIYVLLNSAGGGLVFSTSLSDVQKTQAWLKQTNPGPAPSLSTELYNYSNGLRADLVKLKADASSKGTGHIIKTDPSKTAGDILTCTEHNSDWAGAGQDSRCTRGLGPFNRAYHPNPRDFPSINVDGLLAVEYEKVQINQLFWDQSTKILNNWNRMTGTNFKTYQELVNHLYSPGFNGWATFEQAANVGPASVNPEPPLMSGLRLYPKGLNPYAYGNVPWGTVGVYTSGIDQWGQTDCCSKSGYVDSHRIGKVTSASTPGLLINQITASTFPFYYEVTQEWVGNIRGALVAELPKDPQLPPPTVIYNFFRQRCQAMKATQADIDNVWQNTKLEVGETWYVYVDPESKKLTANTTLPSVFGSTSGLAPLPLPPKVLTLFKNFKYQNAGGRDSAVSGGGAVDPYSGNGSSNRVVKAAEFGSFAGWPAGLMGKIHLYSHPFEPLFGIVNSKFDFNIHNRLFLAVPQEQTGHHYAQDNVILEEATGGTNGCVGRISFSQNAYNIGGKYYFVAPD